MWLADFTLAIELRDDYVDAWFYRGEMRMALGEADGARGDWTRARDLDPDGWAGQLAAQRLADTAANDG